VTSTESFDHVGDWLNEVNRYASEGTCKLLVGNKNDRPDAVPGLTERAKSFADELGIPFLETSAKSSQNVEEAFLTMASELIKIREAKVRLERRMAGAKDGWGEGRLERRSDSKSNMEH